MSSPKPDALGHLFSDEAHAALPGTATVLVAPAYEQASSVARDLAEAHAGSGARARVMEVGADGGVTLDGTAVGHPDEEAWGVLSESLQGTVVVVHGPLAEAAAASLRFLPAISVTDGGSVEEARLRLSASARKARLLVGLHGGDFDTLFGTRDASEHGVLSDLVGRIVGLARVDGDVVPARVALYPDGLDGLSDVTDLIPAYGSYPAGARRSGTLGLGDLPGRAAALGKGAYLPVLSPFPGGGEDHGSRSFGHAFLPRGTGWPSHAGRPYDLLLQLDLQALPEPVQERLGTRGTLQLFADLTDVDTGCIGRTVDHGGPGAYAAPPRRVGDGTASRSIIGWREVTDHPHGTEFSEGRLEDFVPAGLYEDAISVLGPDGHGATRVSDAGIDHAVAGIGIGREDAEALADALTHHDGDKLFGWPTWTQSADWPVAPDGRRMVLLFQFQMTDAGRGGGLLAPGLFASDGTAHVFVTEEGEPAYAFGWACG